MGHLRVHNSPFRIGVNPKASKHEAKNLDDSKTP